MAMIGLPQSNDLFNLMIGYFKNNRIAEELVSSDAISVVQQGWSTTGQLHCSSYHWEKLSAVVIMGGVPPTLGMNTALCDAAALDRLLDTHKKDDDWTKVLPAFSAERVTEGSMHLSNFPFTCSTHSALMVCISSDILVSAIFCGATFIPHPDQTLSDDAAVFYWLLPTQ